MCRRPQFRFTCTLAVLALGTSVLLATAADRVRIVDMNGRVYEGTVEELPDRYKIRQSNGITTFIRKNQVREMVKLADEQPALDANVIRGMKPTEPEPPPLSIDEESVAEMLEVASAETTLETDHFVLIYTSERRLALKLSSRLEATYRWVEKFMGMAEVPFTRPEHKLEIYFFTDHDGYKAYGDSLGGIPDFAAGFYTRSNNRSAFYDLRYEPSIVELQERANNSHWRVKQYVTNRIDRRMSFFNLNVIQHEATHHLHFNVGLFPPKADLPIWVVEGLAQMFEMPPGRLGGSLGATNHYRLALFQVAHHPRARKRQPLTPLKTFISDSRVWEPEKHYPYAWALTHYLWKERREQYAGYMQLLSQREEEQEFTPEEQLEDFEKVFGPVDKDFQKEFLDYIFDMQFRRSALDI